MQRIKCLIIEDEESAVRRLQKELDRLEGFEYEVLAQLDSVSSAVDWFGKSVKPDLIFMDIQLVDGLSFEIFRQVEVSSPVIFITAYDEYAIQAFRVNGLDYLLKPIEPDDLRVAIHKYQSTNTSADTYMDQLRSLASHFAPRQYRSSFLVSYRHKMLMIDIHEVAYLYIKERAVFLKCRDDKEYLLDFTLDDLEKQLDPAQFFRANRQYIISRSSIMEIEHYFTGRLLLVVKPEPTAPVTVSKEKVSDFKRWADF